MAKAVYEEKPVSSEAGEPFHISITGKVVLLFVVIVGDVASLLLLMTVVGAILGTVINFLVGVFVYMWYTMVEGGGTGNLKQKRKVLNKMLKKWGIGSAIGLADLPTQTIALLWNFLDEYFEALRWASAQAEKTHKKINR